MLSGYTMTQWLVASGVRVTEEAGIFRIPAVPTQGGFVIDPMGRLKPCNSFSDETLNRGKVCVCKQKRSKHAL
jgi:hypothetical protein